MSNTPYKGTKLINKKTLALAITASLAMQVAQAQEANEMGELALEEVIVTATKRAVNLQEVPLAVTSLSGNYLVEMQIDSVLDLEKAVPGLVVASYGNNPQAVIRGAGAAGTTDIAVPIYHNGMYLPTYGQALAAYIDLERVEVLRGPQGTLFGRNTFGGLINVITKKPDFEAVDFGGAVSLGDYDLRRLEGFVNIPMGETVALRISAADEKRDPYVENIINPDAGLKDSDYTYARAQLLWQATDDLSFNFGYSYWKDTANGNLNWGYKAAGIPLDKNDYTKINVIDGWLDPRMGIYSGPNCPDGDRAGGRSQAGNVCDGDVSAGIIPGNYSIDLDSSPWRELKENAFWLNMDWNIGSHQVVLNAAHFDYTMVQFSDADYSRNPGWFDGNNSDSKSTQLDLIFTSMFEGPLQYTAGFYYFDNQSNSNTGAYLFGSLEESWYAYAGATPETPSWAYWNTEGRGGTKSWAVYGQADYAFTDKWTGTLGLRYNNDDRKSQQSNQLPWDASLRLGPAFPTYNYDGTEVTTGNDSHVDYRVGTQYQANDNVMVYGSYATAYIAGGTDIVTGNLLDPQTNDTLEFGVRSTLLDGDMVVNATIYSARYDGLTTTAFEYPGGTDVAVAVQVPGGSIKNKGIEIEGFWTPTERFTMDFGVSIMNSEFDDFIVNAGNLVWNGQQPIGSDDVDGQYVFIMNGKQTPYSPDLTIGVGAKYDFSLGDYGTLTPWAHIYYNSGYWTNRAPVFFGEQGDFTKLDLSLGWTSPSRAWTATLWVNNATDELIQTYTEILSRARVAYDYQAPRTWGIRLGYNF